MAHRVIYIEASRGCPFTCEFCLSSLDVPVRQFPLDPLLAAADKLLERGVRQFKFVDRTFNLNIAASRRILEFFLERQRPGLFVHFEMIPDRLPEALREVIAKFPPGALQFEVGIQTFDEAVSSNISRRQDYGRLADNLRFLREQTGVHVHADLIAGLPGETLESFAAGFDRLVAMGPQEIQVGILKRLRGTPIVRHDQAWEMVYSAHPPYEILRNKLLDFATMQRAAPVRPLLGLDGEQRQFCGNDAVALEPRIVPLRGLPGFQRMDLRADRAAARHRAGRAGGIAFSILDNWREVCAAAGRGPDLVAGLAAGGPPRKTGISWRTTFPMTARAGREQPPAPKRQARHLSARDLKTYQGISDLPGFYKQQHDPADQRERSGDRRDEVAVGGLNMHAEEIHAAFRGC